MLNTSKRHPFFLALLILASVAFGLLMMAFWQAIFWAVVFGILFRPVEVRLSRRLQDRQSLAASLTVVLIFFTVLLPALSIALAVIAEASAFYTRTQSGEFDLAVVSGWIHSRMPALSEGLSSLGLQLDELSAKLSSLALSTSKVFGSLALSAGQNVTSFVINFFLMLYLLFFILRDGDRMLDVLHRAIPLPDHLERRLFLKFAEVARATVKGSLIIGLAQGLLGGCIFALLGIQGAIFWGVVMVVLSVVPAVGAGLVWAPAAFFLVLSGSWLKALILVAFGVLVIGLLDNFLRPILVGRDTKMPDYVILMSTLGGLALFGFTGIVLGPIIAALCLAVWQINLEPPQPPQGSLTSAPVVAVLPPDSHAADNETESPG